MSSKIIFYDFVMLHNYLDQRIMFVSTGIPFSHPSGKFLSSLIVVPFKKSWNSSLVSDTHHHTERFPIKGTTIN